MSTTQKSTPKTEERFEVFLAEAILWLVFFGATLVMLKSAWFSDISYKKEALVWLFGGAGVSGVLFGLCVLAMVTRRSLIGSRLPKFGSVWKFGTFLFRVVVLFPAGLILMVVAASGF